MSHARQQERARAASTHLIRAFVWLDDLERAICLLSLLSASGHLDTTQRNTFTALHDALERPFALLTSELQAARAAVKQMAGGEDA